jgi:hypothetical protein
VWTTAADLRMPPGKTIAASQQGMTTRRPGIGQSIQAEGWFRLRTFMVKKASPQLPGIGEPGLQVLVV